MLKRIRVWHQVNQNVLSRNVQCYNFYIVKETVMEVLSAANGSANDMEGQRGM